jgi:hypothetical protein
MLMRILSWDVGIINLAYCLIDYNKENKKYSIVDWDLINLTDREKMKCFHCQANPSFYQSISNKYSCKHHVKLLDCEVPCIETLFLETNLNNSCCFVGKKPCDKKSKYTYMECDYCNVHAKSKYKSIGNSYKNVPHGKKAIDKQSMDDFIFRLITELEKRPNLLISDNIVIENQPSLKNPRMKTISVTLYNYYTMRGIIDRAITSSTIKTVRFMAPSNKLKLASEGDTKELVKLKGDDSSTYKLTKQLGVKYCKEMIEMFPEWLEKFNSCKKKDDMADCFLQGMYAATNS